jgi:membrane-associated phospholipid phosphatase
MPRRTYLLALAVIISAGAPPLQAQVADTIANKQPLFTLKDVGITAAFVAGTIAVAPVDHYFAHRLQDSSTQTNRWLHGAATGLRIMGWPGSFIAGSGLYIVGKASHNRRTATVGLHSVQAILLADIVGGGEKAFFGRARPYVNIDNPGNFQIWRGFQSNDYRSFPSGHAINAFAFAATVSRETEIFAPRTRWYVGTVMYGAATLVGISRMYNNDHWASDIVAGAGIGTLIGLKVVKYQHSHPGNRIDKALLSVSITPEAIGSKAHLSLGF